MKTASRIRLHDRHPQRHCFRRRTHAPGRRRRRRSSPRTSSARTAVFVLGEEAMLLAEAERRPAARRRAWRRDPGDGRRRRAHRQRRRRRQDRRDDGRRRDAARSRATRSIAGSITSRSAPDGAVAWSAGKSAFVQARSCANSRRPRPSAASPFCRRAFGSPSRTTTAPRSGFRMRRRPRRKSSNGRARISASRSAPTAASWSPPCRSRCCTAGASPTASTCACRATRRA